MKTIVLCLEENLLDLDLLKYKFDEHFGDTQSLSKWKDNLAQMSKHLDLKERSTQFRTLFNAVLQMTSEDLGIPLIAYEKDLLYTRATQLPLRKNMIQILLRLKDEGHTIKIISSLDINTVRSKISKANAQSLISSVVDPTALSLGDIKNSVHNTGAIQSIYLNLMDQVNHQTHQEKLVDQIAS